MREKIFIIIGLILISSLLSGCLGSEVSEDQQINLDASSPTFNVDVRSDSDSVQWYIDDNPVRKDAIIDTQTPVIFTLNYKDYKNGNHTLRVVGDDADKKWNFHVEKNGNDTAPKEVATASANVERGYNRLTPWDDRHTKARKYWDAQEKK